MAERAAATGVVEAIHIAVSASMPVRALESVRARSPASASRAIATRTAAAITGTTV
jgi:hypothetical protein